MGFLIPSFRHSVIPPSKVLALTQHAINLTFTFQLKNQPSLCKHALCWPHQLFGTILGRFGKESVRFEDITLQLTFDEEKSVILH